MESKDTMAGDSRQVSDVTMAINHLGFMLYKELKKDGGNSFFSPLSLSVALAMAFHGAKAETAGEMRSVLGFDAANLPDDKIKHEYLGLITTFSKASEFCVLEMANVAMGQQDFPIKAEFKNTLKEFFHAEVLETDFVNNLQKALQDANDWVKEKTHGMIPQLLDKLDPSVVLVILNAVYFKGLWLHRFQEKATFMQYFYNKGVEDSAHLVEMMHLKETFLYFEGDACKAIVLPYKGNEMAMMIILPEYRNGLEDLESEASSEFLESLKSGMRKTKVEVALPKFRLEYSKSMVRTFQNLGMSRAFEAGADFGGISDSEEICISDIIHKSVIEVNEEGSEVVAATAVVMSRRCLSLSPEFIVDHPFMFVIYNSKNNLILFMGKVEEL